MMNLYESNALIVGMCVGMGVPILIARAFHPPEIVMLLCLLGAVPVGFAGAVAAVALYRWWISRDKSQ